MLRRFVLFVTVLPILFSACSTSELSIDYEKYTLENGLDVVLHQDKSDPIVSVAIVFHVGSNREEPGRTGFAHLFEHLLFQQSENVGLGEFTENINGSGGTYNGATGPDRTWYYEVVPKNALELVLWMESDRMGYLLSTVTQEAFENQQDVVQNEKRQRVDNRPYGHTDYVIRKNLYPEGHPYNWDVIGSFEDLQNASLEDVKNFYLKWYGPNNATLVIAGDYDPVEAKSLVEKYFGDLQSSGEVLDPQVRLAELTATKRLFHEDNFANSPELNMVYPTPEWGHRDDYVMDMLSNLLSDGKKSPLYRVIVEDTKLAPAVAAFQVNGEIASNFRVSVRAFPTVSLTDVEAAVLKAFADFEEDGFSDDDLERIRAKAVTRFYNGLSSVLNKASQLGVYNEFFGSPGKINDALNNYMIITEKDIWRVYNRYIKDQPYVLTSFVPKGLPELAAENSVRAEVVEEVIGSVSAVSREEQAEVQFEVVSNPSSFDRSVQPALGTDPLLTIPEIWHHELANGIPMAGIEHHELPLVQFSITIRGGQMLDDLETAGVANMVSDLMMEGTANRTPRELEEAIDALGSTIVVSVGRETMTISAQTLASKFDQTIALVEEMLFEPRWDAVEFERLKEQNLEAINRGKANPGTIGGQTFRKLLYGAENIIGNPVIGLTATVEAISIEDLKAYYNNNFSHTATQVAIVGDLDQSRAKDAFKFLEREWPSSSVDFPAAPEYPSVNYSRLYFVDVPDAKQSQIYIGNLALAFRDNDYYPANVMNYMLGAGGHAILYKILRQEKGYTYGAYSWFAGTLNRGYFAANAAVKSDVTTESVSIFKEELERYVTGVSDESIDFTKNALIKTNARRFETLGALMGMLNNIQKYDLADDYIKGQEAYLREFDGDKHQALARKYINPGKMVYLVVGDAKTQLESLKDAGLGDPVLLEID